MTISPALETLEPMHHPDFMGADGGRLAAAFAAGCVTTWGFVKAFVSAPITKAYETRISALEDEKERCEARTTRLETMLWMHGGPQLRADIQGAISETHIELRRAIEAGTVATPQGEKA